MIGTCLNMGVDEVNINATDMFIRKLRRFAMHDLMYTSGLTRTTIESVLNTKKRPATKTILALSNALTFIENGGYDNRWRSLTVEEIQNTLHCDKKRARFLLNG